MPDPYRIDSTSRAHRDFSRLSESVAAACMELVHGPIAHNPHRLGKPLRAPLDGLYAARRGNYRVVYRIDEDTRTVVVARIDHRADVYRP